MNKTLLILSFIFIFLTGCLPVKDLLSQPATPNGSSHAIVENGLGLVQLWEKKGVILRQIKQETPLAFIGDYLILLDLSKDVLIPRLSGIDVKSGNLIWERALEEGCFNFITNQSSVFISTEHSLRSYNIKDGSVNWETYNLPSMKIYAMQVDDKNLYAYYEDAYLDKRTQVVYVLDATKGNLLETKKIPSPIFLWRFQTLTSVYGSKENEIFSDDKASSQIQWKVKFDETFAVRLGDWNQQIVLATSHMNHDLYAIDLKDGNLIWQYNHQLASNSVMEKDSVFTMEVNGRLLRLNSYSGYETGNVLFSQEKKLQNESQNNLIAISGDLIAIYFADNSQLVVYKITK